MKIKHTGKILDYANYASHSKQYIETGTCTGNSIQRAIDAGFELFRSVELSDQYYIESTQRFYGNPDVLIYKGNSVDMLPQMIIGLDAKAVFFLDAHPAGPGTAGHNEFVDGDGRYGQDAVITKELEIILAHRNDHVIIIDDQNGENKYNKEYIKTCLKANPNYTFEFWDENLSGDPEYYYKSKILVCMP